MSDYMPAADLQATLAAIINVQESFLQMYIICTKDLWSTSANFGCSNSSEANQMGLDKTWQN